MLTVIRQPASGCFLHTSESVSEGHLDKLADQISDAIVDACLTQDPDSKIACETCIVGCTIMVLGEITTMAKVDYDSVVRETCRLVGYDSAEKGLDYKTVEVLNKLEAQSPDIAQAVHGHFTKAYEDICAGDQGHMFGYATDETPELMPLTHSLATKLSWQLAKVRKDGSCPWVLPDGQAQVTAEYMRGEDGTMVPTRIHTILVSAKHVQGTSQETINADMMEKVINPVVPAELIDSQTCINPPVTERFVYQSSAGVSSSRGQRHSNGGAGLTGRQMAADTFGGWGAHGGGALSGKDCSKVDRSAAYGARWAAKSLVKAGLCARCLVQVSFAIGLVQPTSLFVESYGSSRLGVSDEQLCDIIKRNFDFRPGVLIRDLKLQEPQFQRFAAYGHFGREEGAVPEWEKCKDLSHEVANLDA